MTWFEWIAIISAILAGISIIIAFIIAYRQDNQIKELQIISSGTHEIGLQTKDIGLQTNEISLQTKDITLKMQTDKNIQKNVNKLFKIKEGASKSNPFHMYFPVEFSNKPLPLINQGDFYAIHIIENLIGDDRIKLHPINRLDKCDISKPNIDKNLIFICAPHANPALNSLYPVRIIKSDDDFKKLKEENWPLNNNGFNLPCWFVEDSRDIDECATTNGKKISNSEMEIKNWTSRKIWVSETQDLIESPTELLYQEAFHTKNGSIYIHPEKSQQDFGILARLTINDHQLLIIAGVHQYGTWIIGGLLNNILTGLWDRKEDQSIFFSDKDFVSVIWGEFNYKKLKVERTKILTDYAWTREGNTWNRIP